MAQNRKTRRTLGAVRRKFADKLGLESAENPVVPFEGDDGQEYTIPHPLFAGDEWSDQVDAAKTTEDKARAILGEDQYERFIKAHEDHTANSIFLLFLDIQTSLKDELVDGGPTQS